ncbi:hypothetical protein JWG45_21615 [Leptospira sp. 201903070]|uniref:C-type lectin domain-containing protein n=1 Tax=Leptospira ainlahdjerensis TaxID=2810033 RepID=A0ABS2UJK2_9LEPT|nr:hypothetical protein [Leptospira ainlahdjerensis]MBM9579752.1 hypothetical protein [Leptospira ainlahdjerensis]
MNQKIRIFVSIISVFCCVGLFGQTKEEAEVKLLESKDKMNLIFKKINELPTQKKGAPYGRYVQVRRECERGEDYVKHYNNFKGAVQILTQCIADLNVISTQYSLGISDVAIAVPIQTQTTSNNAPPPPETQTKPSEPPAQNEKPKVENFCGDDKALYVFSKRKRCALIGKELMNYKAAEKYCNSQNMRLLSSVWMANKAVLSTLGEFYKSKGWDFKDQNLWLEFYDNKYSMAKASNITDMFSFKIEESVPGILGFPVCDDTRGF